MLLEQNHRIFPDGTSNLGLDAVAGADQRFSVLRQNYRHNIPAILGDERAARSGAVVVVANQLPLDERNPGFHLLAGYDLDVDKGGTVDVLKQEIPDAARKACGDSLVLHHRIIPMFFHREISTDSV